MRMIRRSLPSSISKPGPLPIEAPMTKSWSMVGASIHEAEPT
jgi:hypothetical protein